MVRFLVRLIAGSALAFAMACGREPKLMEHDAGPPLPMETCLDNDGDSYPGTGKCADVEDVDCDDNNADVHPSASEVCNGIDDDCDAQKDEGLPVATWYVDADSDGVGGQTPGGAGCGAPPQGSVTTSGDCNDSDAAIRPGVAETCNDVDDDCDGTKDNGLPFQEFYVDMDGDGFGDSSGMPLGSCLTLVMGRVPNKSDCNDRDPTVKPGATELCNKRDDNCDGQIDNGIAYATYYLDTDGDGFGASGSMAEMSCGPVAGKVTNATDCNDSDPTVKPNAPEMCNGTDDDCDGTADDGLTFASYYPDVDGDGVGANVAAVRSCVPLIGKVTTTGDCNDTNMAVKPGVAEVCNGVDDDCVGGVDNGLTFALYYADADGDGYGAGASQNSCLPVPNKVTNNTDCNDGNASVNPAAVEVCNGLDDNCIGGVDNGLTFTSYYPDNDGDGFGNSQAAAVSSCTPVANKVANNSDCDDALFAVKPGAAEVCNGRDDNCVGGIDEGLTFTSYYPDLDSDGYGSSTALAQSACSPPMGKVTDHTDCNDGLSTIHPGAVETCNGVDDNCDSQIDNGTVTQSYYIDSDGDGFGVVGGTAIVSCTPVSGRAPNNTDCNDGVAAVHPGAAEVCNGVDDNCVGGIDNGLTFLNYWPDADLDGFGSSSASPVSACQPQAGKVTNNTDCNDGNGAVKPGVAEVCNQVDDNCVGGIDDGLPKQSYWADNDGDGFGAGTAIMQCGPFGRVANNTDCNDASAAVKPTAIEVCNGVDDNCTLGVDEGNPGGGAACTTTESGICAAGTRTCQSGALNCVRNVNPSVERCNGLDDDCNGSTDETFTDKGQSCTAGQGVCARTGARVCLSNGLGTACSVDAGAPTAPACDGLDNDCDGVTDEPYLSSTYNVASPVQWADIEVAPYYYSASGCQGGKLSSGSDVLAGGGMAMAVGANGFYFQRLDASGVPVGTPVTAASSLQYVDVALAQSGDGFMLAGIYAGGTGGTGNEIDLYYVDGATGAVRTFNWSLFNTGHALDSLRVVRSNGGRVIVIWRDNGVGLRWFRVEPTLTGTTWEITQVGGAALTYSTVSSSLVANAAVLPGVGADSALSDWGTSQTCVSASTLVQVGVAYRVSPTVMKTFTVAEAGSKGADTDLRTVTASRTVSEPDVAFFRDASVNHWFVSYVMKDTSTLQADLEVWLSNHPGYNWAWLSLANANGADSIARPRGSVSATELWVSALRWVADGAGFKQQVMTRRFDYSGSRDPTGSAVEVPITSGACSGDPPCRAGDKDGFTNWAPWGRVYYSAGGSTPTGAFSSTLTCQ